MISNVLIQRINKVEESLLRMQTPTLPIYDNAAFPQDAISGQIALGVDNSINWYDGSTWTTIFGVLATVGNVPQDAVEGQIVISTSSHLCWYVNGAWYTAPRGEAIGVFPQDSVEGQLVIGNNSIAWYDNGQWWALSI